MSTAATSPAPSVIAGVAVQEGLEAWRGDGCRVESALPTFEAADRTDKECCD